MVIPSSPVSVSPLSPLSKTKSYLKRGKPISLNVQVNSHESSKSKSDLPFLLKEPLQIIYTVVQKWGQKLTNYQITITILLSIYYLYISLSTIYLS